MSELLPKFASFLTPLSRLSRIDTLIFFFTSPSDMAQPITPLLFMHLQETHSSTEALLVPSPSSSFLQLQQKSKEIQSVMKATPSFGIMSFRSSRDKCLLFN